jgi:hypothetical protein
MSCLESTMLVQLKAFWFKSKKPKDLVHLTVVCSSAEVGSQHVGSL